MIQIRVPLILAVVDAIVYRLDVAGTRALDPPGAATSGYDDAFREPVAYDTQQGSSIGDRVVARVELTPVRVPCQVETTLYESLSQAYQGNLQQDELAVVFHVKDLTLRGLIDTTTNRVKFNVGDRIAKFEKHNLVGVSALPFTGEGCFIRQIFPASWGFGDSYDLWVAIVECRDKALV